MTFLDRKKKILRGAKSRKRAWSIAREGPLGRLFTQAKFVPYGYLELFKLSNVGADHV